MRQVAFVVLPAVFFVACGGAVVEPDSDRRQQSATAQAADEHAEGDAASSGKSSGTSGGAATNGGGAQGEDDGDGRCSPGDTARACTYPDGNSAGWQTCQADGSGHWVWGQCFDDTPLVLVFDGAPVAFEDAPGPTFDLAGDGASHVTSWPNARTPWLALDRDGNGRIDDGSELFGSMTRLASGARATNGFEALAELDSNHDGAISPDDDAFAALTVWADADASRTSSAGELTRASERIERIDLRYRREARCAATGDCEIERATLTFRDAEGRRRVGEVVDVHLRRR